MRHHELDYFWERDVTPRCQLADTKGVEASTGKQHILPCNWLTFAKWIIESFSDQRQRSSTTPYPKLITQICPHLHHLEPLVPVGRAVVGPADGIRVLVRQHGFDHIRVVLSGV